MGGHPYWYFVGHQSDTQAALDDLRDREFKAGRYNPVIRFIEFNEPQFSQQTPGAQHESIEAAMEESAEDGTRSILDISRVGSESDYFTASPLTLETVEELYGTKQPTREMVDRNMGFMEEVERGKCVYLVLYEDGHPAEICFAGYSFD